MKTHTNQRGFFETAIALGLIALFGAVTAAVVAQDGDAKARRGLAATQQVQPQQQALSAGLAPVSVVAATVGVKGENTDKP